MANKAETGNQIEVVKDHSGRGVIRVLSGSKNYFMRFRFFDKKGWTPWRKTKTSDVDKAAEIASNEYQRLRARLSDAGDRMDVSNFYDDFTFVGTAKRWLELYKRKAEMGEPVSGSGKAASLTQYQTYKDLVERYMNDFFKRKNLDSFKDEDIYAYIEWRRSYFTTGPGAAIDFVETMRKGKVYRHKVKHEPVELRSGELAAIKSVFAFASKEGLITAKQIPEIPKSSKNIKDIKKTRHPAFSKEHWKIVEERIGDYINTRNEEDRISRTGFKYYMLIMAETGLRPGMEHSSIRWRHVEFDKADDSGEGIAYINVPEETKTGSRVIIVAPHGAKLIVELKEWTAFAGDEYPLFANQKTGVPVKRYSSAFKKFLAFAQIERSKDDKEYAPYSLRHTYATRLRERGLHDHIIARLMGHSDTEMIAKHYGQDEITSHTDKIVETDKKRAGNQGRSKSEFEKTELISAVLSSIESKNELKLEEDDGSSIQVEILK
jgi:integrase